MKFFKSDVSQIAGPGGKDINFLSGETEITKEYVNEILDDFFDPEIENSEEMRDKAWELLKEGKDVTLNGVCISTKKN
jgi:hypothetical protein